MDDVEFAELDLKLEWLVKNWVVAGQNLIVGGPPKCLKTSVLVDLAVSIAAGVPFLDTFEVPNPEPVLVISGESGLPVIQDLRRRVVESKKVEPLRENLLWTDTLPTITRPEQVAKLETVIEDRGVKFAVLDPAYLAMFAAGGGDQASNVMAMGPLLREFGKLGERTGCTLTLVHHFRKQQGAVWREPTLQDLALSGFAEWARQWMMLSRPERYRGDGRHQLYLEGGGAAAGASQWALHVEEGQPEDPLVGKRWEVDLIPWAERDRQQRAAEEEAAQQSLEGDIESLLRRLRNEGEAVAETRLRRESGIPPARFNAAIIAALDSGELRRETNGYLTLVEDPF
jgi:hypothetical protein